MARTPHLHIESHFIDVSEKADSKWSSVQKHNKFISDWDENIIIIDVAHHQADNQKEKIINLNLIALAVHGKNSIYTSNKMVSDFSNLCDMIKLAINAALFRYEKGNLSDAVGRQVSLVQKVFIWMARNGIYKFSELTPNDFNELSVELAATGWWGVLDYDSAFQSMLAEAKVDQKTLNGLLGAGKAKWSSLNYDFLKLKLGLPFPSTQIPMFFREGLTSLWGDKRPNPKGLGFSVGNSPDSLQDTFSGINLLALHPQCFDGINFLPFPFASKLAKQLKHNSIPNRTDTISLPDAICIFKEATKWVYVLSPAIISIVTAVREVLEKIAHDFDLLNHDGRGSKSTRFNTIVKRTIEDQYRQLKLNYNFPYDSLNFAYGANSLKGLIHTLQTASFILIAINHGRRLNEIIGKDLPYGLYRGCVTDNGYLIPNFNIEIYIEKTIQDYSQFSCNQVVADCVNVLEKLFELIRPLNSSVKTAPVNLADKRKEKLFKVRNFSVAGFLGETENYDFSENSKELFRLSSVQHSIINNRAHPFRRLFALLYMYRFDHPELIALQNHLRHISPEATHIYISSGNGELSSEIQNRLNNLANRENVDLDAELHNTSVEYLRNKITDILEGQLVGGYFPRLVSKLIVRLNTDARFIEDSISAKSCKLTEAIVNRGFMPIPMSTGVCMVGKSKHTRKIASCYENNQLNPSKASPETCSKCVNHLYPINSLAILESEIEELVSKSQDIKIPRSIRDEFKKEADKLTVIKELEVDIAESNKTIFDAFAQSWSKKLDKNYEL